MPSSRPPQPVMRIRGRLRPADVAKLLKKGREPRLDELVRLFKDRYGYEGLEVEVELDLQPERKMGKEED